MQQQYTPHQYDTHLESLEHLFDTIQGIVHILEDDACRACCEGPDPVFTDFHRGTLHTAIQQLTQVGYKTLAQIDAKESSRVLAERGES